MADTSSFEGDASPVSDSHSSALSAEASHSLHSSIDVPESVSELETASIQPSETPTVPSDKEWRPVYLQRRILITFIIIFIGLIIIIEILLAMSKKHKGLAASHDGIKYLWKFTPTAIFTILAAVWGRLSFQVQIFLPWHNMLQEPAKKTEQPPFPDYLDMHPPIAIFQAFKYRDWPVSAAVATGLFMRIMLILSTGLMTTRMIEIETPIAIELQNSFVDMTEPLSQHISLDILAVEGVTSNLLDYPEGTSAQLAYQTTNFVVPHGNKLKFTVDALTATLQCQEAEISFRGTKELDLTTNPSYSEVVVYLRTPSCGFETSFFESIPDENDVYFAILVTGYCDGESTTKGNRLGFIVGLQDCIPSNASQNYTKANKCNGTMLGSVQKICVPSYEIRRVIISQEDTSVQSIIPSEELDARVLENVQAWDITQAYLSAYINAQGPTLSAWTVLGEWGTQIDELMGYISPWNWSDRPNNLSILNASIWTERLSQHYQRFGAQLGRHHLLKPKPTMITGTESANQDRVIVNSAVCHSMASLLVLTTVLAITIMIALPRGKVLSTGPTTILGTTILGIKVPSVFNTRLGPGESTPVQPMLDRSLSETRHDLRKPCEEQSGHIESAQKEVTNGRPCGLVLNPVVRGVFGLVLCIILASLELLFNYSCKHSGIGPAGVSKYIEYSWTIFPGAFFGTLSAFLQSLDLRTRSLAPYLNMSIRESQPRTLSLDLLDRSLARTVYAEIARQIWPATFITISSSIVSVFAILTASLFASQPTPILLNTTLATYGSFTSIRSDPILSPVAIDPFLLVNKQQQSLISSLLLRYNISFPPLTYQDLVFPQYRENDNILSRNGYNESNTTSFSIQATVPALRSQLNCTRYNESQIHTNLILNYTANYTANEESSWIDIGAYFFQTNYPITNPLTINIDGEHCLNNESSEYTATTAIISTLNEGVTQGTLSFAVSSTAEYGYASEAKKGRVAGCHDLVFIWGTVAVGAESSVTIDTFAMGCNDIIEAVDVQVTFTSNNLTIDTTKPPITDETSTRVSPFQIKRDEARLRPYYGAS